MAILEARDWWEFIVPCSFLVETQGTTYTFSKVVQMSTKASCVVVDPLADHSYIGVTNQCELYVEDIPYV